MHLNNTKHENNLTKYHDTREIKNSIIKWPIKDLKVKNGLIHSLSQSIFLITFEKLKSVQLRDNIIIYLIIMMM